ncbi:MAG: START domain-containing protein [bacterium]|nr:START domain-containing protein [bacterium]
MKKISYILIALFLAGLPGYSKKAKNDWELVINKDKIKGYTRTVEGSDVLEIRATAIIDAGAEVIGETFRDVDDYTKRSKRCIEARKIKRFDRSNFIIYYIIGFPGPISDRDFILDVKTKYDMDRVRGIITITALKKEIIPKKNGCVRVTDFKAQYILEYIGENKTGLIYTGKLDPAGYIPKFLVNIFSKKAIYNTMKAIRKTSKQEKYIKTARNSADRRMLNRIMSNKKLVKKIFATRLSDYIKNREFIKIITGDKKIIAQFFDNKSNIGEILLSGWGSYASKKTAVKLLLKDHLKNRSFSRDKINSILDNKQLIRTILQGRTAPPGTIRNMIKTHIKEYR